MMKARWMTVLALSVVSCFMFTQTADAGEKKKELTAAIINGDVQTVRSLIEEKPRLLKAKIGRGRLGLLAFSAPLGQAEIVEYLIDSGLDPLETTDGQTLLHLVARYGGGPEVTRLLLEAGVDPMQEASMGEVSHLNAVHMAAAAGRVEMLSILLASGADIEARDSELRTPMQLAATHCQAGTVEVLRSHGADPEAADKHGISAARKLDMPPCPDGSLLWDPQAASNILLFGGSRLRVVNPELVPAVVGLRRDGKGLNLTAGPGASRTLYLENGDYEIILSFGREQGSEVQWSRRLTLSDDQAEIVLIPGPSPGYAVRPMS